MVITRITPILFGGAFEALSLACKKCYQKSLGSSDVDNSSLLSHAIYRCKCDPLGQVL
jgi:hypothetical protein